MSRIRVDDLHGNWMKDPKFRREYEALEEEFSLVAALIEARTRAGLTQKQVARRMKTTQAVIARLEGRRKQALHPHVRALRGGHGFAPANQLRTGTRAALAAPSPSPAWIPLTKENCVMSTAPYVHRNCKTEACGSGISWGSPIAGSRARLRAVSTGT